MQTQKIPPKIWCDSPFKKHYTHFYTSHVYIHTQNACTICIRISQAYEYIVKIALKWQSLCMRTSYITTYNSVNFLSLRDTLLFTICYVHTQVRTYVVRMYKLYMLASTGSVKGMVSQDQICLKDAVVREGYLFMKTYV